MTCTNWCSQSNKYVKKIGIVYLISKSIYFVKKKKNAINEKHPINGNLCKVY